MIKILNFIAIVALFSCLSCKDDDSINDGLKAYYPFDGNINDQTGNYPTGKVEGATLTDDRNGNKYAAYHFTAFTGINLGNILDDLEIPFTVSAWVKPEGQNSNVILSSQDDTSVNGGFIFLSGVGSIGVSFGDGKEIDFSKMRGKFAFNLPDNTDQWTHICAVVQAVDKMHLYVNGQIVEGVDGNVDHTLTMDSHFPDNVASVGMLKRNGFVYTYEGAIDEIKVWGRALNDNEVKEAMK